MSSGRFPSGARMRNSGSLELMSFYKTIQDRIAKCKVCNNMFDYNGKTVSLALHLNLIHGIPVDREGCRPDSGDIDIYGTEMDAWLKKFPEEDSKAWFAALNEDSDDNDSDSSSNDGVVAMEEDMVEDEEEEYDENEDYYYDDDDDDEAEEGGTGGVSEVSTEPLDQLLSVMVFQDDFDPNHINDTPQIVEYLFKNGYELPTKQDVFEFLMRLFRNTKNDLRKTLIDYRNIGHKFSLCIGEEWYFNKTTRSTCFEVTIHLGDYWHSLGVVPFCKFDPLDQQQTTARRRLFIDRLIGDKLREFGLSWKDIMSITYDTPMIDHNQIKFPVFQQRCYNFAVQRLVSETLYLPETSEQLPDGTKVRVSSENGALNAHSPIELGTNKDNLASLDSNFNENIENDAAGVFATLKDLTYSDEERMLFEDNYKYNSQDVVLMELSENAHRRIKMLPRFECNLAIVRKLLAFFLKSTVRKKRLAERLAEEEILHKLVIDRPGRWNTTLVMVERFLGAKDAITRVLYLLEKEHQPCSWEAAMLQQEYYRLNFADLLLLSNILRPLVHAVRHLALPDVTLLVADTIINALFEQYKLVKDPMASMLARKLGTELSKVRNKEVVATLKMLQCNNLNLSRREHLPLCTRSRMAVMGAIMMKEFMSHPPTSIDVTFETYYRQKFTQDNVRDLCQQPVEKLTEEEAASTTQKLEPLVRNFESLLHKFKVSTQRSDILNRLLALANNIRPTATRNPWRTYNACHQIKLKMKTPMNFDFFNAYIFMKHFLLTKCERREPDDPFEPRLEE